ncbi:MAG: multicopper oxidase domain-containing protein [Burkholderiales bacterium]|nr:multicopper oxidase domain-containing protein [Burkholderiales bacterium]
MSFFISNKDSKARQREAEIAMRNRAEVVKARSLGEMSRRDFVKAGVFTTGGLLVPISGLSPFARSAYADVPTGAPRSPLAFDKPFVSQLLRCDNLKSEQLTSTGGPDAQLMWADPNEAPAQRRSNHAQIIRHRVNLANKDNNGNVWVEGTTGPKEGRAPGEAFAHQRWDEMVNGKPGYDGEVSHPLGPVGFTMSVGQIKPGISYNLADPRWPAQDPSKVWTFAQGKFQRGSLPLSLMQARYGETVINRIYNNLPFYDPKWGSACFPDCDNSEDGEYGSGKNKELWDTGNGGWGRQEPAIHNHNGHNGSNSDGAQHCHFFPGQYYDYNYSLMLARRDPGLRDSKGRSLDKLIKIQRGDPRCSTPTDDGGIIKLPGDYREIQGTLWFHDHRISYTSENVYKGYAALLEYFSGPDRGYERPGLTAEADAVNLRLPSGWRNKKTWGNRDFDVYLLIQDVAFDKDGQLRFDIFDTNGFCGDCMHVNFQWKPNMDVLPRKYRFRTLSAGMSRWIKLAISDSLDPGRARKVPITVIANDGNINPRFLRNMTEMDIQSTAERYEFVIDFSKYKPGTKLYMVNMLEHSTGEKFSRICTLQEALSSKFQEDDPALGAIMQFTVASEVPSVDEPGAMNTIANSCGANDMSLVVDPNDFKDLQGNQVSSWEIPTVEPTRTRVIELVRGADGGGMPWDHEHGAEPWGVKVNGGSAFQADMRRVSNLPRPGDIEHWTILSGGGWGHPMHLHFEEAKTIARNNKASSLHPQEKNMRKDVWHVGNVGNVTFQVGFGEFGGAYVNHCHNTVHEDNAMLLRYDLIGGNTKRAKMDANGKEIIGADGKPVLEQYLDNIHITVLPTPDPRPEGVTYVDSCYLTEGNPQGFDAGVSACDKSSPEIGEVVESSDWRIR